MNDLVELCDFYDRFPPKDIKVKQDDLGIPKQHLIVEGFPSINTMRKLVSLQVDKVETVTKRQTVSDASRTNSVDKRTPR